MASVMIDPHNRESFVNHGWLEAIQVIILLGFTETIPGKHLNQIEMYMYMKMQISAFLCPRHEMAGGI